MSRVGCSDVDSEGDFDERKSTCEYAFLLNSCTISWSSKKFFCAALSTMEVEHAGYYFLLQEAVWLRSFICGLCVNGAYESEKVFP